MGYYNYQKFETCEELNLIFCEEDFEKRVAKNEVHHLCDGACIKYPIGSTDYEDYSVTIGDETINYRAYFEVLGVDCDDDPIDEDENYYTLKDIVLQ